MSTNKNNAIKYVAENPVYTLPDIMRIFQFGRTKTLRLCKEGALPVVKVGKSYISNQALIDRWMLEHEGCEINI